MEQALKKKIASAPEEASNVTLLPVQTEEEEEIDLLALGMALLEKLHCLVFFAMVGALLFNAYSYFLVAPTYESTSKLYIVTASNGSVVDLTDLNIGSSLKSDYKELIVSYPLMDQVVENLGLDYHFEEMQNLVEITNTNDTRILNITVTTTVPELSMQIANEIADVAVEFLPEVMSTDPPNIAQRARLADRKANPSCTKYTAIGAVAGLVLAAGYFVVIYLMDDTIHSEEDMESYLGELPLTTIPYNEAMDTEAKKQPKAKRAAKNKAKETSTTRMASNLKRSSKARKVRK